MTPAEHERALHEAAHAAARVLASAAVRTCELAAALSAAQNALGPAAVRAIVETMVGVARSPGPVTSSLESLALAERDLAALRRLLGGAS